MPLPHYPGGITIFEDFVYIGKTIYTDKICFMENTTYKVGIANKNNLTSIYLDYLSLYQVAGAYRYLLIESWFEINDVYTIKTKLETSILMVKKWKFREMKIDKILN
jgi:hypothetical protein